MTSLMPPNVRTGAISPKREDSLLTLFDQFLVLHNNFLVHQNEDQLFLVFKNLKLIVFDRFRVGFQTS